MKTLTQTIKTTTKSLSSPESVKGLLHQKLDHVPLPSNASLEEIIQLAREILLPGYFGQCKVGQDTPRQASRLRGRHGNIKERKNSYCFVQNEVSFV